MMVALAVSSFSVCRLLAADYRYSRGKIVVQRVGWLASARHTSAARRQRG